MPTTSVTEAYAKWLATPPVQGIFIETLEISGAALPSTLRFCNRNQGFLQANDENGVPRTYQPLAFTLSKPGVRNSTEVTSDIRLDALGGGLLRIFSQVRSSELQTPIYVAVRFYVDPIMLDRPVWKSPLRFRAEEVKVGATAVELTCTAGRLPNKRAGQYYTLDKYVGLRPF
jgi:hypothetical protein